jgi:2-dehydropantoate 2-reductase
MRIAVLGGGAMGTLFAALLGAAGTKVTLVDRDPEQVAAAEGGIRVEGATERTVPVPATTDPGEVDPDLVLVFVKSYQTEAALAGAGELLESAAVCTFQNGLANAETLAEFVPEKRVYAGTTAHGATELGPAHVRHAGTGPTRVGRYFASDDGLARRLARLLSSANVETEFVPDPREAVWEKTLINAGVNAPTALARVENGALVEGPGERVLRRAVGEGARVARAEGRSPPADIAERALAVARDTAENVSSMRADVEAGRRTEVEALYGELVRRGKEHGVETPINRTLTDLLALAYRGQS